MSPLLLLGLGIGLASVAGVRAFVPLLVAALTVQFGLLVEPSPYDSIASDWWPAIGVFAGLAVVEIALDKIRALEPIFGWVMVAVRAASGAVLLTWAVRADMDTGSLPWLAVGAVIAGVVAVLKVVLRPRTEVGSAGVSTAFLSVFEDIVALVGAVVAVFIPFVSLLLVAFLLFFFYRIRRRRGRKYGGLRILGD